MEIDSNKNFVEKPYICQHLLYIVPTWKSVTILINDEIYINV